MESRPNATSLVRRLRERVRSTVTGEPKTTDTDTNHADHGSGDGVSNSFGNLFHCSRCSDVYIATEKRVCPACKGEVEQVRSTLACNGR